MPVALVLSPVCMQVGAIAVSFIIDPLSLILVACHVPERTLSMRLVKAPISLVARPVLPNLDTATMPILFFPLAKILGPVLENELRPIFHLTIVIVLIGLQAEVSFRAWLLGVFYLVLCLCAG